MTHQELERAAYAKGDTKLADAYAALIATADKVVSLEAEMRDACYEMDDLNLQLLALT